MRGKGIVDLMIAVADGDRRLPLTPDFADFLLATPEAERHGPLFRPLMPSGWRANDERAGRMVSLIGELAGVVVHTHAKTGKVKYASAHDLRRSFGTRMAKAGVSQEALQKMMRHASYQTTQAFYIDLDGDELAEDLYKIYGRSRQVLGQVDAQGPGPAAG